MIVIVLAITTIIIFVLIFIRVKKRTVVPQHIYDYIPQSGPQKVQDQHQNEVVHTIDGRKQSSTPAKEGEPAESISLYAVTVDTEAGGIRTQENSAYQPSTNFSLAINQAYETNVGIAPDIETQENSAYQPSTNFSFAINQAYATNVGIAPDIETQENSAYQPSTNFSFAINQAYASLSPGPEIETEENSAYQ